MTEQSSPTTDPTTAVLIERVFDAPIETLWRMWTEPAHFAAWYGPRGAEVSVERLELIVGGGRLVRMAFTTPGGTREMWFTGQFVEIEPPVHLVYTEAVCDADERILTAAQMGMPDGFPVATRVEVDFAPVDGGTRIVLTHHGVPADSPGAQGWRMALDKLAEHLAG